jgi:hypothetical protein
MTLDLSSLQKALINLNRAIQRSQADKDFMLLPRTGKVLKMSQRPFLRITLSRNLFYDTESKGSIFNLFY